MEGLQDYFPCEVTLAMDKKRAWLGQPHLIKSVEMKFGEWVKKLKLIKHQYAKIFICQIYVW